MEITEWLEGYGHNFMDENDTVTQQALDDQRNADQALDKPVPLPANLDIGPTVSSGMWKKPCSILLDAVVS